MIKISQVKSSDPYISMEKFAKCIEFSKGNKNFDCSIVVHDAYSLKLLRYDNGLVTFMGPDGKEELEIEKFVEKFTLVYSQARYNETIDDVEQLLDLYSEKTKEDFNHMVLFMPKDLLDVMKILEKKVGLDENDFYNYAILPLIENTYENINNNTNYKNISKLSILTMVMETTSVKIGDKSYFQGYNTIFRSLLCALIDDSITRIINKGTPYNRSKYEIIELVDIIINNYALGCTEAFKAYTLKGDKSKLESLYSKLLRNAHKYGLSTYIVINKIENMINNYGHGIWSNVVKSNEYFFSGISRILTPDKNTLTYGESGVDIARVIDSIPGARGGMDTSHVIGSSFTALSALEDRPKEPALIDTDNTIVVNTTENQIEPTGIHAVHFRRFLDRMEIYKQAKTFENDEERLKMVNKMISLMDEIGNTKKSFTRTSQFLTSNVKEINLNIYDLLIDDAKEHIDYLNNIKYYGTDDKIEELNDNHYIGKTSGEDGNFNWLSVPVEYFLGPDIATGRDEEAFSENYHDDDDYGYDDNGRKAIFGGKGGLVHNFKNNVMSRNIYDRKGRLIRNSRDRLYYNGTHDNNMTKREVRALERKFIGRSLLRANSGPSALTDLGNVFKWGIWKLEKFTSGFLFVLNEILGQLTFELVYFEDGLDKSIYRGNIMINLDSKETFEEANYRNTLRDHYEGRNQQKTLGDRVDDTLYAVGGGAKKLVKGVAKTALVATGLRHAIKGITNKDDDDDDDYDYEANTNRSKYVKHKLIFIDKVINPVLSLYNTLLGKPLNKANRFISTLFNKKPVLDKFYDDANVVVDKILVGMRKDNSYTEDDIKIIEKLKSNLVHVEIKKDDPKGESFDVFGMDLDGVAYGEAFDLNGVNVVETKTKTPLKTKRDVKDMIIRLLNTVKENAKVSISTISIINEMDDLFVFIRVKNNYIVFDISRAYEGDIQSIPIDNIRIGNTKVVINVNDLDPTTVENIISGKILLTQNKKDDRNKKKDETQEMTEEDIRNEAVRKLEMDTLKKINDEIENKEETEEETQ